MNTRNVEALYGLLRRLLAPTVPDQSVNDLAIQLAGNGCLVPAALTDEECGAIDGEESRVYFPEYADQFRAALERLARGDGA